MLIGTHTRTQAFATIHATPRIRGLFVCSGTSLLCVVVVDVVIITQMQAIICRISQNTQLFGPITRDHINRRIVSRPATTKRIAVVDENYIIYIRWESVFSEQFQFIFFLVNIYTHKAHTCTNNNPLLGFVFIEEIKISSHNPIRSSCPTIYLFIWFNASIAKWFVKCIWVGKTIDSDHGGHLILRVQCLCFDSEFSIALAGPFASFFTKSSPFVYECVCSGRE